ncbi:hypothetical protein [Acinetobacter baumannii]|uniref:hypothetical protein n=1 Tax=Acinetobacter baumannii TaxID=470 RepID=UPI000A3BE55F|nr:hypothetical protein [Acinetobacter baumannii]OTT95197.1 hypothetical protein CAT68_16535 [Acinetobacter baumannii]
MWDCLVKISTWAEQNSGQIQIIIALFAFWYAYKGYQKVLYQIQMAKDQSSESEKQTKFFADQVKEAAKQTGLAAKQFENSNLQVQQLIDHRNLVLNIRTEELRSECIDICLKALLAIQETEEALKKGIRICEGRISILKLTPDIHDWLQKNIDQMKIEKSELRKKSSDLITISGGLATNDKVPEGLNETFLTVKMIYLRAIRTKYIYEELAIDVDRSLPIPRL